MALHVSHYRGGGFGASDSVVFRVLDWEDREVDSSNPSLLPNWVQNFVDFYTKGSTSLYYVYVI